MLNFSNDPNTRTQTWGEEGNRYHLEELITWFYTFYKKVVWEGVSNMLKIQPQDPLRYFIVKNIIPRSQSPRV